jgi:hypothetical protein
MIQKAALDAIIRHTYAESRLAIAKLRHDSTEIIVFKSVVEHLLQARFVAVRAYQEHEYTHLQEAASATRPSDLTFFAS